MVVESPASSGVIVAVVNGTWSPASDKVFTGSILL